MSKGSNYPKNRKPKLSSDNDKKYYPNTYLKPTKSGKPLRYISGNCEICGGPGEMLWGNFVRIGYVIKHLKCAQKVWNDTQVEGRNTRTDEDLYDKVFKAYVRGAMARGMEFSLSFEMVKDLVQRPCFYCGFPPRPYYRWGHVLVTGIDRIDNKEGYTVDNCQSCCTQCNFMKRDLPAADWFEFLLRVRAFLW